MVRLPTEVLLEIASNLYREFYDVQFPGSRVNSDDILNFRLVSSLFARVGMEYLYINKYFYIWDRSLERLHHIASHPVLCRRLTEIVFLVDIVPAYKSQKAWESQAYAVCHVHEGGELDRLASRWLQLYQSCEIVPLEDTIDPLFRTTGWQIHQQIRKEQEELLSPGSTIFRNIQQDLAMLQKLKSFGLKSLNDFKPEYVRSPFILGRRRHWYCLSTHSAPESFQRVAESLINAVMSRSIVNHDEWTQLSRLSIYGTPFIDILLKTPDLSPWLTTLKHLSVLGLNRAKTPSLDTSFDENIDPDPDYSYYDFIEEYSRETAETQLERLLSKIDNLRVLNLDLLVRHQLRASRILSSRKWPNLVHLGLGAIHIRLPSFKAFLSSHADSLRDLNLAMVFVDGPRRLLHTLVDLLKFIKSALRLSDLMLGTILHEDRPGTFINAEHPFLRLHSGELISIEDVARFLVCGHYPEFLEDPSHPDHDDFKSLGWQDLQDLRYD